VDAWCAVSVWVMQTSHDQQASRPTHIDMPTDDTGGIVETGSSAGIACRSGPRNPHTRRPCGPVAGGDAFMQWPILHLQPWTCCCLYIGTLSRASAEALGIPLEFLLSIRSTLSALAVGSRAWARNVRRSVSTLRSGLLRCVHGGPDRPIYGEGSAR